jgi:hypothetical protein
MIGHRDNRTQMGELGPYDEHRELARPLDACARAMWRAREERTEPRLRRLEPDAMDMASGAFALVMADADAVITTLRKLGFINDIGLRAIKEEKGK